MTDRPIRQALLSVSDKTGIVEFAQGLVQRGVNYFPQAVPQNCWSSIVCR